MSPKIKRRQFLSLGGAGLLGISLLPPNAWADVPAMAAEIKKLFGSKPILNERITLTIPILSESGYFVPVDVEAKSPMTKDDYVRRIAILSDRNPIPLIASYNFTPYSGIARASGKVRLGGTQNVHAIAEMSDGTLYGTSVKVFVTLAACVVN